VRDKLIETGKNILIVLLICTLLLLMVLALPTHSVSGMPWLSRLLQPMAPLLGMTEAELTYVEQAAPMPDGAQPLVISVRGEGRYTAMWDDAALDEAFALFSPVLGQAIDASQNFMQVTDTQVHTALSGPSVLLRYSSALPASLLASWFDSTLDAAVEDVDTFILAAQDDALTLYLLGSTKYAANTRLTDRLLLPLLENYTQDGSAFAYEQQSDLAPLSILPESTPTVAAYYYSTPSDSRYINALATSLGFNPYAETRYTDDHGTACFNETNASLQIRTDGTVLYQSESSRFTAAAGGLAELTETARRWTDAVLENISGDGRLYLSAVAQSGDVTVCEFEYVLDGLTVQLPDAAARVTFSGNSVTEATIHPYAFSATGKILYPLPLAQACAILPAGAQLELAYHLSADGTLTAGWIQ